MTVDLRTDRVGPEAQAPPAPEPLLGEAAAFREEVIEAVSRRLGTGRVETVSPGPFRLESGALLADLTVAYRHDGLAPDLGPQVLVVHALTGSADAAGDWWSPLIGPGRALDTTRLGVVCVNLLGGCYGTTGPTAPDPITNESYGARFPQPTVRDLARAQWATLDALGIDRLELVIGGSLGGMVSLEVALLRPSAVRSVIPIAAPAATGPMAIAWNHIQMRLIDEVGAEGLRLARQLAMTTYRSEDDFDSRFGRRTDSDARYSIVSYLEHQGDKLLARFDPDTYRVLVRAMDGHDIGRDRGGAEAALSALAQSGGRLVGVGITGDLLFGPSQVRRLVDAARIAGVGASYREIVSSKGHDAFLVEWPQLGKAIAETLFEPILEAAG